MREQRRRLHDELQELKEGTRGTVRAIAGAGGEPSADFLDQAVANGHQAVTVQVVNGRCIQLEAVLTALQKFDEGWYGHCDQCSEEIGRARLKAIPAARYCISCKSELERAARRQGSPFVAELASD